MHLCIKGKKLSKITPLFGGVARGSLREKVPLPRCSTFALHANRQTVHGTGALVWASRQGVRGSGQLAHWPGIS